MVGGLGAALFATLLAVLWTVIGSQIAEAEERNEALREGLAEINRGKREYVRNKAMVEADTRRLESNRVKLVRLMESKARELGITIENFKENKRYLTENHRKLKKRGDKAPVKRVKDVVEESQTITLRRVDLETLTRFMADLEGRPEPIKITRIRAIALQSDRQVLREVRLTVATYRKEEVEN